jgi:hypothetical protein
VVLARFDAAVDGQAEEAQDLFRLARVSGGGAFGGNCRHRDGMIRH